MTSLPFYLALALVYGMCNPNGSMTHFSAFGRAHGCITLELVVF
jgi:hypothetical protein